MSFSTWYSGLTPMGRTAVNAGGVLLAIELIQFGKNAVAAKGVRQETQQTSSELQQSTKTQPLSFPKSQYASWANNLEDYMFDAGTDKTGILGVMKQLKNDSDYLALKDAFGSRVYYTFGISYGKKTLGQWLAIEDSWLEYLVDDINKLLASKKIKGRF